MEVLTFFSENSFELYTSTMRSEVRIYKILFKIFNKLVEQDQ